MRDTQLAAYDSVKEKLSERREIVFKLLSRYEKGLTLNEIMGLLQWPINCISGRITELSDSNLICDSGIRRVNPSGRKAIVWIVKQNFTVDEYEQGLLI